nr:RuBisCO long chain, Form III-b [uncultured archaeon]
MLSYINLRYKPKKEDLVVEYYLEPNRISLERAACNVAAESSIGTWTDVKTLNKKIIKEYKPNVFYIDEKEKVVKISYNSELFEKGNMPQILSSIAGNIFGMRIIKNLRLEDIHFPKSIIKSFKGPEYGIKGIRELLRIKNRPLTGTIIKPKLGLNAKQHADVALEAWLGGVDIVKDDENLADMKFNKFEKRVEETLKARNRAEKETGEKKIYMPNVTAETNEMLRRAKYVKKLGGEYVMVDIITAGFSTLQTLRDAKLDLVIHAHRAGHAAFTRHKHGISMLAIAKIARLIGVDQLHIGTAHVGKMDSDVKEVTDIGDEIEDKLIPENITGHILEQRWYNIKPVLAVASGGLHPRSVPKLLQRMGKNIVIQAGGGIHGHPDGTRAGATAIRQAVDATMRKISLREYAKTHIALKRALERWH